MRHVKETSGMGDRGDDWNEEKKAVKEAVDVKDTVTMDIPLLIRVLEYAREDAKTDMDLHKVVENLINMRGEGALSMDMYNKIVAIKEHLESIGAAPRKKWGQNFLINPNIINNAEKMSIFLRLEISDLNVLFSSGITLTVSFFTIALPPRAFHF
jgi:hypothetical protein